MALIVSIPFSAVFAGGETEKQRYYQNDNLPPITENAVKIAAAGTAEPAPEARAASERNEIVLQAIAAAYPDRVNGIEFYDGDWTIFIYGQRFFYAGGRLLPAGLREKMSEYNPIPFYNYQKELPPWVPPTEEESARMKEQEANRKTRQIKRSSHFNDTLWRTRNRDESWEHVKQIRFLGHPVQVHYSILVALSLVEEQILRAAKSNAAVSRWVSGINSIDGWNWRNIASVESRSYHSYGAAIDILPKSLGGLETYWMWTAKHTPEWWTVPYTKRFHPPDEVIKIFESFGFIWGGKWRYYDTMHFEYRPEILILSGMELTDPKELR